MVGVLGVKTRSFLSLPAVVVLGRDAFGPLVVRAPLRAHSTVVARICSSAKNISGYLRHPCRSWRAEEYAQTRRARWALTFPVQQHRTGRGLCNSTSHPHPGHAFAPRVTARATEHQTALLLCSIAPPPLGGELGACSPHGRAPLPEMEGCIERTPPGGAWSTTPTRVEVLAPSIHMHKGRHRAAQRTRLTWTLTPTPGRIARRHNACPRTI